MTAARRPERARADHRVDVRANDRRATMPARSQARQRAAGAVLSERRGKSNIQDLEPPPKSVARAMSEQALEKMASTPTRGKPEYKHDA